MCLSIQSVSWRLGQLGYISFGKPVAHNHGLVSINSGRLYGVTASWCGLCGFQGRHNLLLQVWGVGERSCFNSMASTARVCRRCCSSLGCVEAKGFRLSGLHPSMS